MSVEIATPPAEEQATAQPQEATAQPQEATAGGAPPGTTATAEAAPEPEQPPYWATLTEGRIVHYVFVSGAHRPAMVVALGTEPGTCNLRVFTDGADDEFAGTLLFRARVEPDPAGREPLTWHWPERAG